MQTLIPGFSVDMVGEGADALCLARGGDGAPLVLLHGFPQSHAMFHKIAPELAKRFSVFAFDLPGYGASAAPDAGPARYSKRRMASDIVAAMGALGVERFLLCGHDRGGRVGYRMALDHPDKVAALAVLDIVPTGALWAAMKAPMAMKYYHWAFLAQPDGLPERLVGADPEFFLRHKLGAYSKGGDLSIFDPAAFGEYIAAFSQPERLKAMCDDYRAGSTIDDEHDRATIAAGAKVTQPTLVLWGAGAPMAEAQAVTPLDVWRDWATNVRGQGLNCGHYLCEEAPEETLAALMPFLEEHRDF